MKNLQFNPYQCGARQDGLGLKRSKPIPALSHGVGLIKILPHHLCRVGKICMERSGEGRVKQSETKLTSLTSSIQP